MIRDRFFSSPMPSPFQPVDTPPDSALIARFQSGESGVFDQLYLRHRDRIHGVISHIIHNPDDVHDLTQEVFLGVVAIGSPLYAALNGAEIYGGFIGTTSIIGLVSAFIYGSKRKQKDHQE